MQIAVLGSGTGIPTGDRGPAGYAVRADDQLLLLDSGSGSLEKLARLGMDYRRVGMVLITHCHADHTLDLVSLIHALNFTPGYVHERPLRAVGPPGFVAFLERLLSAYPSLQERSFAFEASEAGDGSVLDLGWVRITAVDVPHGNTRTNAYRLVTPDGVVVFSGDCSPSIALAHLARQADVMVSEASFAHTTVASDPHMTAGEAGHLAQAAGVGTLILTHLYPGSSEDDVRSACAREFRGRLIVARDGMCVELERAQLSSLAKAAMVGRGSAAVPVCASTLRRGRGLRRARPACAEPRPHLHYRPCTRRRTAGVPPHGPKTAVSSSSPSCCSSPARGRDDAKPALSGTSQQHSHRERDKKGRRMSTHANTPSKAEAPGGVAGAAPAGSSPAAARRNAGVPVVFFDTTLRDGEQSPGISLNMSEKLEIAQQLVRLGVDVIEAGFPATSPGDFEAVQAIAREVKGAVVCGLARCVESDIRTCWDAIKDAERPRIHTFVSTSDIHLEHQIRMTRPQVLELTREMVTLAVSLCPNDVEFSAMDATRSDPDFLAAVLQTAIDCGATTINVPDTVGYTLPSEFAALIDSLYEKAPGLANVVLSVHCHNDLGLAVANSLAAIEHGATQVEVAVNGLGERAGNAAIEEIAMALVTRRDQVGRPVNIVTTEIARTSRMVSNLTGYQVQPNKAIVGKNAFAHESGIHQDGVLKERTTFEIMHAKDIGLGDSDIVLGKHSGRHALKSRLAELGIHLSGDELDEAFRRFKEVADKKKQVTALDLEALATEEIREREDIYSLTRFYVSAGSEIIPTSQVEVVHEGAARPGKAFSGGSVESVFRAIDDAVGITGKLLDYRVRSISSGKDALAEVRVAVEVEGRNYAGQAVSIDVLEASAKAYMRALNNVAQRREASGANPERVF